VLLFIFSIFFLLNSFTARDNNIYGIMRGALAHFMELLNR